MVSWFLMILIDDNTKLNIGDHILCKCIKLKEEWVGIILKNEHMNYSGKLVYSNTNRIYSTFRLYSLEHLRSIGIYYYLLTDDEVLLYTI